MSVPLAKDQGTIDREAYASSRNRIRSYRLTCHKKNLIPEFLLSQWDILKYPTRPRIGTEDEKGIIFHSPDIR
jgi:hypothetical protein